MIFYKMTGSGNDFVFLDGRETAVEEWPAGRIQDMCARRSGVGADGVVIITPRDADAVVMTFFNSDGTRAAMCGNAALCSTRLAAMVGLAPDSGMLLITDAGDFRTRCVGPGWMAELNLPAFEAPLRVPGLEPGEGEALVVHGTVGVPHLVVLVPDIEAPGLMERGHELRWHTTIAPDGANVNFVARPADSGAPWPIRTYERGVEGETLACGTGTVAVGAAIADAGITDLPQRFLSRGGQILSVAGTRIGERWEEVWLCGEGRLVYKGTLGQEPGDG
jgi:diaminopimelate epimerase